jgi:glycosyltransferase involved in cell wall biosynthesis
MDRTYAWEKVEGGKRFSPVTLTECEHAGPRWRRMLKTRLWEELNRSKPDVVAVPGWSAPEALAALEWCVMNLRPAVLMSESARQDEIRRPWKEWFKCRVAGLCSAVLVGGRMHAEYLVELGMPRERIFLGYDAVDNDYFANRGKLTDAAQPQLRSAGFSLQEQRNFPPEPVTAPSLADLDACCRLKPALRNYFLASARFVEKKNLPRLIEAFARYRGSLARGNGENRRWDLILLGDGEMRPALEAQVAKLNLKDHVSMPGFKQYAELPLYYGSAGAFIHASATEQWGLVVNEAMASGLPVLVSNRCGCASDLVKKGINGFTFDPVSSGQLAELMRRVAEMEPARRAQMGARSRELIAQWGTERFASGLTQAVETALRVATPRATLLDRLLLRVLAFR